MTWRILSLPFSTSIFKFSILRKITAPAKHTEHEEIHAKAVNQEEEEVFLHDPN